jgi:plastocyanin
MKRRVISLTLVCLVGIVALIYSCTKSVNNKPPVSTTAVPATIQNFAFAPATITIKAGQTIMWTNKDTAPHTVTSTTGAFDSGQITASGGTFSMKFSTAGTFIYHCTVHPMMANATIVVTN